MKLILTIIFLIAIAVTFSCQQRNQHSSSGSIDTVAILASIDSVAAVVQKANDLRDNEMLKLTWAKDGILSMPGVPPIKGRDAIIAAFAQMPPLPPGGKVVISPIEIKVVSANWVYVLGVDTMKFTPPGASKPVKETSTFFVLVKKTSEGWLTFREVISPHQLPKGEMDNSKSK